MQGIPVHILNLLDECIIIPQFGLIRSLNVHVSGGMLLWAWVAQAIKSANKNTTGGKKAIAN
jgi:tRNA guanosine-2'-O-methyltransferase